MDGVFLSAQLPPLKDLILGRKCRKTGCPELRDGFGLVFDNGILVICARPDSPGLWWHKTSRMTELQSPAWSHHLEGAEVLDLTQPGADRILTITFRSAVLYGNSEVRLVFEATGRNTNVILVRKEDNRILACHRKIPSAKCRYRTVAPGQVYVHPPSSGLSPGSWSSSDELRESILNNNYSPVLLYRTLEGVGPVTARAMIRQAEKKAEPLMSIIEQLEKALLEQDFSPWEGPEGPLPIRLGEGEAIPNPLVMRIKGESTTFREDRLETWQTIIRRRLSVLRKRNEGVSKAIDRIVSPGVYRMWGNLLLSYPDNSKKGLTEIILQDWEGSEHKIPLKPSRSLKSNAGRFFRKASNTGIEQNILEERRCKTLVEMEELEKSLLHSADLSADELDSILRNYRKKIREGDEQKRTIRVRELSDGWRCLVGRNARENDEITFRMGKRGDLWFHSRGITGAHAVLKLDGRSGNPPANIIFEAAAEAAKGSGITSGVIPVDYTRIEYVNRIRKGKPGQVVYSREKTVFVDLDKLS